MSSVIDAWPQLSELEYLRGEEVSEVKHEYIGGRVYAKLGATDRHGLLTVTCLRHCITICAASRARCLQAT